MKLRGFAALAALVGAVMLAGWGAVGVAGFGSASIDTTDVGGESVASKNPSLDVPGDAVAEEKAAAAAPVADAAVVHASLLIPYPMLVPSGAPAQPAAVSAPEPAEKPMQVTGSIRPASEAVEVKKAIIVAKLDRDGTFTVAQIARIKASLRLTPDQERHWTPVEAELREIARQLAAQKASGRKKIALGATEAQRLYWAAGPLIMSLREDQKQEVRRLARAMGLEQVASLI